VDAIRVSIKLVGDIEMSSSEVSRSSSNHDEPNKILEIEQFYNSIKFGQAPILALRLGLEHMEWNRKA
jgi:hypothetical protein